jgi:hypothetical protein
VARAVAGVTIRLDLGDAQDDLAGVDVLAEQLLRDDERVARIERLRKQPRHGQRWWL